MDATPQPAILDNEAELKYTREIRNIQREISTEKKSQIASAKELYSYSKSTQEEVNRLLDENEEYNITLQQGLITFKEQGKTGKLLAGARAADKKHSELSQRLLMKLTREQIMLNRESIQFTKDEDRIRMAGENKWVNITKQGLTEITGLKINELDLTKRIGKSIMDQGVESEALAYTLGAIVMMLKGAFDLFKKMDTAAWEFRKAMGMSRVESAGIRKDAEGMAIDYMAMGVTIDQIYKSYQSIGRAVGGVHNVTKEMARDVALMSAQLGIAENTSVDFMRNLAVVSRSTMESQQNMLGLAQSFTSAAGVPLDQVMKDVGTKSATTLTLMSRMPTTLIKAATELRRMGTSMDDVAAAGAHILDFQTSMEDEMASSVLLGKNVSFQKARELTYARDLEGAAKETLKLAQQNGFAHKMDYFQQQAFAKASGYSVDQLLTMVQTSEQLAAIKRGTNVQAKAELASYEKMRHENEATLKARAKDSMYQIRTMANQQRIVQIQNKWNELLAKAEQFLLPVVDLLLRGALVLVDWAPAIMGILFGWTKIVGVLAITASFISQIGGKFVGIGKFIFKIVDGLERVMGVVMTPFKLIGKFLGPVMKAFGFLGKFAGVFGEFLGPIGLVIMGFQAISGIFRGWSSTTGNWIQKFGGAILGMLEGVIPGFSYVEKLCGWIWSKVGGVAKALFMWTTPIGWAIMALKALSGHASKVGGSVSKIWSAIKHVASAIWTVEKFLFKWFTPIGLIIQAFKGLKNLMPETFGAIGNLLSKVGSTVLKVGKVLFTWWLAPIKQVWHLITSVGTAIKGAFLAGVGAVKSFFGLIDAKFQFIKSIVTHVFTALIHVFDHFLASIVNGISNVGSKIANALKHPFHTAWSGVKKLWGGHSPSQIGLSILKGIQSVGGSMHKSLTQPFSKGMDWIMSKIPGLRKMFNVLHGGGNAGSIETKAQAAYIPAVTVSPTGAKIAGQTPPPQAKSNDDKKSSATLDDVLAALNTQNKLLGQLLAKDTSVNLDGSLISTQLSRGISFKGNYGVNK